MCSFYHQGKLSSHQTGHTKQNLDSIEVNTLGISYEDERKNPSSGLDAVLGQVWVGSTREAICIPANCMKVLQGRTNKITQRLSCMVEAKECNNLPLGLVVNRTMVTPNKSKRVPIVLVNTNSYNVWVRQPLLAADIVEAKDCPWDYQMVVSCDGNNIKVSFCPVPTSEIQAEIKAASVSDGTKMEANDTTLDKTKKEEQGKRPKFGPRPKFNNSNFDFKKEPSWLPFPINIREVDVQGTTTEVSRTNLWQPEWVLIKWWGSWSLWLPQTYYSSNNRQASVFATPHHPSSASSWGVQMFGHLTQTGYNMTLKKLLHVTRCNSPNENWRHSLVHGLSHSECSYNTQLLSFT